MPVRFDVVKLDGYTDGKPSWWRVRGLRYATCEEASEMVKRLQYGDLRYSVRRVKLKR